MNTLSALVPPVEVCAAFIAIQVAVKRHSDREEAREKGDQSRD
jgi:hypothetical protein